jgi:serine/threonine protein phosphatase PrpC
MLAAMRVTLAAQTRPSARARWPNDDRVFVRPELGLVAVADARGPLYGGWHEPVAVDAGWQAIVGGWQDRPALAPDERLRRALAAANEVMVATRTSERSHTTASFTVAAFAGRELALAQIGSSRAYRLRGGTLDLLLPDHTLATRLRSHGALDPDELRFAEGVVERLLGFGPAAEVDIVRADLAPGDVLVLCTDGVWTRLSEAALAGSAAHREPERTVAAIMAAIAAQDDADDHSVAVARVE